MCLSVAVLCMGILAANSATYNINGNMSYNMLDYVASINTRVYKVAGQTDITGLTSGVNTLSTMTFEQIERTIIAETDASDKYYILTEKLSAQTTTADGGEFSGNVNIEYGATDSSVEYYTFYVVINIKETTGDYKLTATLKNSSGTEISGTLSDDNSKSYIYTNGSQSNVVKTDTKNIVMGFSLKTSSMTESFTSDSFEYKLSLSCCVKPTTFLTTLTNDTTNSYWYVELGTLSDGTPIRWRVVSLNGTSKYTYTSEKPTVGTDTVFLQETCLDSQVDHSSDYYKSEDRTYINTLSNWNLVESDISSLITKRNITKNEAWGSDSDHYQTGTTDDYFWLLSETEMNTYLGTEGSDWIWTPNNLTSAVEWYIRTWDYDDGCMISINPSGGIYYLSRAGWIRAAFQLA